MPVLILIFLVGALLGMLVGGMISSAMFTARLAGDMSTSLRQIQLQLDNLEAAINCALVTQFAALGGRLSLTRFPHLKDELPAEGAY